MMMLVMTWLIAVPSFAAEQDCDESQVDCVELDFEGANVSATRATSGVDWIRVWPPLDFNPLIRVRADFEQEMRRSISEVR